MDSSGASYAVDQFGDIPAQAVLPGTLTWHAGVRLPSTGNYELGVKAPGQVLLRMDGMPVIDANSSGRANVYAVGGVHFVELEAPVDSPAESVTLAFNGSQLAPRQTYRLMDAPWGLLARVARPTGTAADVYLDSMVSMAFFDPELAAVGPPNQVVWSGMLIAPTSGTYRMAFATEDSMHVQLDGQPVEVVTVKPDDWRGVGTGSTVRLETGAHRVRVTLDVTHGGRELARWNWVRPLASGAVDSGGTWSVVPPSVLRPDTPVTVLPG